MVDSVTTIGCRRRKATKKPLKAPDQPCRRRCRRRHSMTLALAPSGPSTVPSTTLTSEIDGAGGQVEAAGEDDDGLADRGERQRGAARDRKLSSK